MNAGPDQTANEGAAVGLPGAAYTSLDDASHLSLTINWGDGSSEAGTLVPGTNGGTIANTHRYADNGTYTDHADLDGFGRHHRSRQRQGHGPERRPHGDAEERRGRQ